MVSHYNVESDEPVHMGLSITFDLPLIWRENSGWLWGGRGSVVGAPMAKVGGPGFDSLAAARIFLFQQAL